MKRIRIRKIPEVLLGADMVAPEGGEHGEDGDNHGDDDDLLEGDPCNTTQFNHNIMDGFDFRGDIFTRY